MDMIYVLLEIFKGTPNICSCVDGRQYNVKDNILNNQHKALNQNLMTSLPKFNLSEASANTTSINIVFT